MVAWSPTRYAITSATRSGAHGADAFAERARRELLATGEKVRKREVDTRNQLTPQEEHIVPLIHVAVR